MNHIPFADRRAKLASSLLDGEATIVFAKPAENLIKFTQDNNFLYLTGLKIPEAVLMIVKRGETHSEMLFIERGIPEREVWDGKKMTPAEARDISGVEKVQFLDEYDGVLGMFAPLLSKVWSNLGAQSLNMPLSLPLFRLEPLRQRYPQLAIADITKLISPLRMIKDEHEIKALQKAIDVTGQGIMDVMESVTAEMYEYELEAMLFYRMQRSGINNWGFAPIIASGVNAATLHYGRNDCRIEAGQLVLMDVGASYENYSADITRCFPIDGHFTDRQRQIYQIVLDVQKQIISMIKPGMTLGEMNLRTRELLTEATLAIGLIKEPQEIVKHYMHSVSHFLGMDTHDVGGREAVLEPGHVVTVEPGLYLEEESLGVRIEDDVLVTEEGHIVLSRNIPKEIDEIEAIRQQALKK
ncbi:MAG: M24 family metallopeptidase [Candidatus Cloacimonetes bacterium]|nr:M24 family metallopeptidase [Candidatus Cloacimonadota bacterium]